MSEIEKLVVDLSVAWERRQEALSKYSEDEGDLDVPHSETELGKAGTAQNAAMLALVKQGDALRGKGA